jgi:manganese transport protein
VCGIGRPPAQDGCRACTFGTSKSRPTSARANRYLHSSLVQTRRISHTPAGQREAIRYNFVDTVLALNIAFVINASILVLSASTFFTHGIEVNELQQAHTLLTPLVGTTLAATVFAIALLAAGQSSTLTGTLAGQVVMEGFLSLRMSPLARRLLTRGLAIIPAVGVLVYQGDSGVLQLLILSQVVLSLQLPFAIVPLVRFTSDRQLMGQFASPTWVRVAAWTAAACIVSLNAWLVWRTLAADSASGGAPWYAYVLVGSLTALLLWISCVPLKLAAPAVQEENRA